MPRQSSAEIHCDEAGCTVAVIGAGRSATSLKWNEVKTIVAYKRDVYTTDLVCLGFTTPDGTVEINEEMQGWSQLVEDLPAFVPGTPPLADWWERVAKPPFAPCVTTLFQR